MDTPYLTQSTKGIAKLILFIVLTFMVGCAPTQQRVQHRATVTPSAVQPAEDQFQKAQELADQGDTEKALSIYYSLSLSYPDTPIQGRAWYEMGRLYMKKGYTRLAEERFRKVIAQYPDSLWADASLLELAWMAHEKRSDYQAAGYLSRIETMRLNSLQLESYKKLREILSYQPTSQPPIEEEEQQSSQPPKASEDNSSEQLGGWETPPQSPSEIETEKPTTFQANNTSVKAPTPVEATIGLWLPKNSSYPTLCKDVEQGVRLAAEEAGFKVLKDEKIDNILETRDLVGVVGGMETFAIQKVIPKVEERSIPLITPFVRVPFLTGISPWLFSTSYILDQEAGFAAETGRELKLTTAGVLYPDIPFGRVMAEEFKRSWEDKGGTVILFKPYQEGTLDFTDIFDEMENRHKVPQLLFLPCSWEEARLIIPQIAYHEFEGITVMGVSLWAMASHLYTSEESETSVLFSNTFSKASLYLPVQEFIMGYLNKYKAYPSPLAAQAYDAAKALIEWYRLGMNEPLSKLRFRGVTGLIGFSEEGKPLRRPFLLQIKQNGIEQLN